jgi:hypothetical protein
MSVNEIKKLEEMLDNEENPDEVSDLYRLYADHWKNEKKYREKVDNFMENIWVPDKPTGKLVSIVHSWLDRELSFVKSIDSIPKLLAYLIWKIGSIIMFWNITQLRWW